MQVTFTHPWYMLFLLSIPVMIFLHLYTVRFRERRAFRFANFEAIRRVGVGVHGGSILSRNMTLFIMRTVSVFFLILALSGMVFWYEGLGGDSDYVVAIDASGSMLAKDFVPTRLDAAKEAALSFVNSLSPRTETAVVSFAGTTFVQKEMSADHATAAAAISNIGLAKSGGTAIGDAIINSINLFKNKDQSKVIILLTDGQNTVGSDVDVAIEYANQNFVTVHTIGMATEVGSEFDALGAVTKLDDETLQSIAEETGGTFHVASSTEELSTVYSSVLRFAERNVPIPLTVPFIVIAIVLILSEWLISAMKYTSLP